MPSKRTNTIRAVYGKTEDRHLNLVRQFPLRPLRNNTDLEAAIAVIDMLIDLPTLSPPEQQKAVTQAAVAAGAGIAQSTISEVLAGKRKLNRAQINKLARYFAVEPAVFWTD